MHNHDDKYPSRPGFETGTSRLQALLDGNEPSGLATESQYVNVVLIDYDVSPT